MDGVSNPKSRSRCSYRRSRRRLDLDSFRLGLELVSFVSNLSAWPRILRLGPGAPGLCPGPFGSAPRPRLCPESRGLAPDPSSWPRIPRVGRGCRALLIALHRFGSTGSIQDVSTAVHTLCESESERLESELSMVRYIAWAIPSIGFIGTVRGIGEALAQAHRAMSGDIAGVTQSLGVAFNSTLIALMLSIFLMFALHQLQLHQERLVFDTESYCDRHLISHLGSR